MKAKDIVSKMTLEEKAKMCSGKDFWNSPGVERLGVDPMSLSDGPNGLRKPCKFDSLFVVKSISAVCFPTAAAMACSWNRSLINIVGTYLGIECQAENVQILLGPGVNMKRSPLCGRNFEYYSEDPYLASEIAINFINGVQNEGIGTSLKHFAANNQESRRMSVDVRVDERTLREIYLLVFERVVKNAKPATIMAAYNRVNGDYCTQNSYLLNDILRNEWGYKGVVMSDWGAIYDIVAAIKAGNDLEMPTSSGIGVKKIIAAVNENRLDVKVLDKTVERLINLSLEYNGSKKEEIKYQHNEHHEFAKEVARETIVLLKNEDNILPVDKNRKIAVIGEFACKTKFQGGGSSHINAFRVDNALEEFKKRVAIDDIKYAKGYDVDNVSDFTNIEEAVNIAQNVDVAIVFLGLPESFESEGYDRKNMSIPDNQNKLIEELEKVQKNIIVVLYNGSPVEMPWVSKVKGIIECYLGGQAIAEAVTEIIMGEVNPSGKLAETFPKRLEDNPSFINFPGETDVVEYKEGIFIGYRYYDKKNIEVLFPFGHGLSYTTFEYQKILVDKKEMNDNEKLTCKVTVKNTGKIKGKEIVQLYVRDVESTVIRPYKELKNFAKIELEPEESTEIEFILKMRDFAYYNTSISDWHVETGDFEILIGRSSRDICLKENVKVVSTRKIKKKFTLNSTFKDLIEDDEGKKIVDKMLMDFGVVKGKIDPVIGIEAYDMFMDMPLRSAMMVSSGKITEEVLYNLINKIDKR